MVTRPAALLTNKKGPGRSPGLSLILCALPDPARIRRHHRLPHLTANRLAELPEVLPRALRPPLACAVWIGLRQHSGILLCLVLAPHLPKRNEEPLRRRVLILLSVHITRLGIPSAFGQNLLQRLEPNPDAAVVGRLLAHRH